MVGADQPQQTKHTKTNVCVRFVGVSNSEIIGYFDPELYTSLQHDCPIITAPTAITGVILHINQRQDCQPKAVVLKPFLSCPLKKKSSSPPTQANVDFYHLSIINNTGD